MKIDNRTPKRPVAPPPPPPPAPKPAVAPKAPAAESKPAAAKAPASKPEATAGTAHAATPAATPAVSSAVKPADRTATRPAAKSEARAPEAAEKPSTFTQTPAAPQAPVSLAPPPAPSSRSMDLKSSEAQSAVQKSYDYLQRNTPSARGVAPSAPVSSQLTPNSVTKDELGMTHVRMDRTQDGVKVFGEQVISHLDKDGKVSSVTGDLSTIPDGLGKQPVKLSSQDAIAAAQKQFNGKTDTDRPPSAERVIMKDDAGNYRNAYQVKMDNVHDLEGDADPRRMNYFVDANSGEMLKSYDQMDGFSRKGVDAAATPSDLQAQQATKSGVPTAPTGPSAPAALPTPGKADDHSLYSGMVDLGTTQQKDGSYTLEDKTRGDGVVTYDAGNKAKATGSTPFTDTNDKWGEATDPSRAQSAVDAHYGAEMTYDFYKDVLGRDSIDGKGEQLKSYVHLDKNYDNAYWDGSQMQYGDGDGKQFGALTTLDIAGHEITHGLTERTAGLVYSGESGGLNESFSDIMGTGVEWYASQKNPAVKSNFEIGEQAYTPGNGNADALRYMNDPTKDGYSLDNYKNYKPGTEVHSSSGISNNAFYLTSQGGTNRTSGMKVDNGIGMDKSLRIYGRALTNYLTPNATFADAKKACISAATDLYGADSQEVETVTAAWGAVGVR